LDALKRIRLQSGVDLNDIETRSKIYAASLWAFVAGAAVAVATTGHSLGNPYVVLALAVIAAIAERGQVQLSIELSESISLVPVLFTAVLFGPLAAMVVAAVSVLPEFKPPYLRWASYTASRTLTAAVTGLVALEMRERVPSELGAIAGATVAGALISQTLDASFAALALRLRRRAGMRETLHAIAPLALAAIPLYAPIVAFLVFAYERLSPLTLPLFFVPALAAQRLFALYQDQRRLTVELVSANDALEQANLSFASALVATLDARDRYTAGHSEAVAVYARDIARRLGERVEIQQLAYVCGLVHDIGKVGLSAGVLEKPGALTLDERREMERHSEIGERILANVATYSEIAAVVRHHHERFDGAGYPDGLAGDAIPMLARIIAVADSYNAMTSDRPYRDAMPSRVARLRLAQAVGTQFDTTVVAAFEAILATADEEYRMAASPEFGSSSDLPWDRLSPEFRPVVALA
jgi:putative nucleotidyltransferase with HDIG domain